MTNLTVLSTPSVLTMSSREIAELTGKRHGDVIRDIRNMFTQLGLTERSFASSYQDATGRTLLCFNLPKEEAITLVAGYSHLLRYRIVKRWQELEEAAAETQAPALPDFTNPAEAARAWAAQFEAKVQAQKQLEEAKPLVQLGEKVEKVRHSVARAARAYEGVNAQAVKRDLFEAGYLYKDHNGTYRVYSRYRTEHFIERVNEYGKIDIYVGPKGHRVLDQLFRDNRLTKLKAYA